jgi:hypothetical protein
MAKISPFARRFLDSFRGVVPGFIFRHRAQEPVGIEYGWIRGASAGVHSDGVGDGLQREPFSVSALRTRIRARTLARTGLHGAGLQFLQASVVGWVPGYKAAGNAKPLARIH